MSEKLVIAGVTNSAESKFYVRLKAPKSIRQVKKFLEALGSDYFVDNDEVLPNSADYAKWVDVHVPLRAARIQGEVVCGLRIVHILIEKTDRGWFFETLEKYGEWVKLPQKKPVKK